MVQQYETLKMKEDEDIDTMFSRFHVLVSGRQVLGKSYTTKDHVNKMLWSLPVKWMPKVRAFQEAKYLNKLRLESPINNLTSHKLELNHDEAKPKPKSITLKSKCKMVKAL